jgi:2-ketoarginine methyltransferase
MLQRGRVEPATFAHSRNLDPEILHSLCDSLYSSRILKKVGAAYALDRKGRILVEVARGWFDFVYGYEELFHHLEALLRREKMYGTDVHRRTDFVAQGSGEVENWIYFPLAADIIAAHGYRNVLDLGCGDGAFLRELCKRNPRVTAYGIDIAPDAIADGIERTREARLEDRVHLYVHDVTEVEDLPPTLRHIDAAITFFVLHEIAYDGEARVVEFLSSFRRLFPGVPLIIFEINKPTPDAMRRRPGMAIQYFMQHELSHQRPVSRLEWRRLFKAAGFDSIEERHLGFARTSIFTLRAVAVPPEAKTDHAAPRSVNGHNSQELADRVPAMPH